MTTLALKAILAMSIALLMVLALRRSRASVRHLVLAALFGFLLLLPLVERFAPRWEILVEETPVVKNVVPNVNQVLGAIATERRAEARPTFALTLFDVYAAGAAILLAWLAIGVVRLRRMETRAEVWLDGTARMNEIAHDANIRRPALVVVSEDVNVPMTFGFRRSTIILPVAAKQWPADELTLALRHELEHVRRDDWFLQLVARAACALYWPVPLAWIAWRRFCLEAERACDDAVVGCAEPEVYAGQLVSLARSMRGMTTVPALGMAKRSRLGERIRAILDPAQRRGPHSAAATAATLAAVLALLISVAPARLIAKVAHDPDERRWSRLGEILTEAAEAGELETVRHYLDQGIDVNTVAEGDGTALIGAARGGQLEMAKFLIERGADVNLESRGDGNPLIAAAESGSVEIVRLLLDEGAEIDAVVPGDETALITASAAGRIEVVRHLIQRGADVNKSVLADRNEIRTPLNMARRGGHDDVEKLLRSAGAQD
jgi:beta-lactamase regulating signal transducer with metallopeptidase domain